jgi:hypothetical protein
MVKQLWPDNKAYFAGSAVRDSCWYTCFDNFSICLSYNHIIKGKAHSEPPKIKHDHPNMFALLKKTNKEILISNGLVIYADPFCSQQLFNISKVECRSMIQPNCMSNDLRRVAMTSLHFSIFHTRRISQLPVHSISRQFRLQAFLAVINN